MVTQEHCSQAPPPSPQTMIIPQIYIIGMYFFPDFGVDIGADQDILSARLIHTYGTGLEAGILGVLVSVVVAAAAEWGYVVLLEAHVVVNL